MIPTDGDYEDFFQPQAYPLVDVFFFLPLHVGCLFLQCNLKNLFFLSRCTYFGPYSMGLFMASLHRHRTFTNNPSDVPFVQSVLVQTEGQYFLCFFFSPSSAREYGKMNRRAGSGSRLNSLGRDDALHASRMRSSPR